MARRYWYNYNGDDNITALSIVGNYTISTLPPDSCPSGALVCHVYAGATPLSISPNLKTYFTAARTTQAHYPSISKPYVYVQS